MSRPVALVSAASGVGDIIRITPLIRVFASLGYDLDVLLAPDYLESVELLDGAREVRRLFFLSTPWCREQRQHLDGLERTMYDVATFTTLSLPYQRLVRAHRILAFDVAEWRRGGDLACAERTARMVGWRDPLPPPFALASDRRFDLEPGTVALHPGCKPGWPWKKWHGFPELAALLPRVVVVGTAADLDNRGTYFGRAFEWPPHVRTFVGVFGLRDTAALLGQCAALVSNDSGMMQLAAALGVPTFGIFGLTSPRREAFALRNMHPISKGLPCEPACRERPWGRRDCEYHLNCLKSLSASEVLAKVQSALDV
jgi:hypothetical protein